MPSNSLPSLSSMIRLGTGAAYVIAVGLIAIGLFLLGYYEFQPLMFGWAGLASMAIHLGVQVYKVRTDDAELALNLFKSNRNAGLLLVAGLMLDRIIAG